MDMIAKLLGERERQGLRQLMIASLVIAGVAGVLNVFFVPDTPVRNWRLASWVVPICGSLLALWLLRDERNNLIAGLLFTFLATSYIGFLAYANYLAVGPDTFAPSAMVRLADNAAMGLIVAATALTLRPMYPLLTAVCVVGMYIALIAFALGDPRTEIGYGYTDFLTRNVISPPKESSNIAYPLLIGLIVATAVRNARVVTRRAVELEAQNRDFSRYFSPNVVSRITGGGFDASQLGGNRQDVVILFSDLEGFTGLSASMQPEEALTMLSEYQGRMVKAIFANHGTLDKFIGDGIMATFGTPDPSPDAAEQSVRAALAMQGALERLNEERQAQGKPLLHHRIGIHAGPALVGNVGTEERLEFTVIGDSVNVASRVERACKALGESLLVSESVRDQVGETFTWRAAGETSVAGHEQGLRLFSPENADV